MSDKPKPKPQIDKFRDVARELECDDDDATFKEKVAKVLKAPKPAAALSKDDIG